MYVLDNNQLEVVKDCATNRMSKEQFKKLTQLKHLNETMERESFTISARRFKVYDNSLKSIHYQNSNKYNYDSKWVDAQLTKLLTLLDGKKSHSGPFRKFRAHNSKVCRRSPNKQIGTSSYNRQLIVEEFFKSQWPRLINNSNNWCLDNTQYATLIRDNIKACILGKDFPLGVLGTYLSADCWEKEIHKLPVRYQSVVIFLLYLQNTNGHMLIVRQWLERQTSINLLDFPIIVYISGAYRMEKFINEHIEMMLIQYRPQSDLDLELSTSILAQTNNHNAHLWQSLPHQNRSDSDFLTGMEWDVSEPHMSLEVM